MESMIIFLGFSVGILCFVLILMVMALKSVTGRITETNKQLIILVAGKEAKPESALRALVTSAKPPQGKLRGIAGKGKKDDKRKNINYTLEVGAG